MDRLGVLVGILDKDYFEYEKRKIFDRLIQLAMKRNIQVIIHWSNGKGHTYEQCFEGCLEPAIPFLSGENRGAPEMGALTEQRGIDLDENDDHPRTYSMAEREERAIFCWPASGDSPAAINIWVRLPGSLDNLVLDLAWTLVAWSRCIREGSIPRDSLAVAAREVSRRLVLRLENTYGL